MEYRQGDVRDPETLRAAFDGVDVVAHLAFLITGNASHETTRSINVDGTLNAFRAAAAAQARRFVYASSVAAYGFHADNPELIAEEWPTRRAARPFYAQEKAELEQLLDEEEGSTPTWRCSCSARRSSSGRTSSAGRTSCPARAFARLPFLPPVAEWVEAAGRPAIMDTTKAREQLGWQPRYSGLEDLRDTLRHRP
jgi:nucleoside-diphosphate-sugar epimerase